MAEHFPDCSGNGSERCWDCGGDGVITIALDDMEDDEENCPLCDGSGYVACPGCEEASAHFESIYDAETEGPLLCAAQPEGVAK